MKHVPLLRVPDPTEGCDYRYFAIFDDIISLGQRIGVCQRSARQIQIILACPQMCPRLFEFEGHKSHSYLSKSIARQISCTIPASMKLIKKTNAV